MDDRDFDRPVQVMTGQGGQSRMVGSAAEAIRWLLYKWPIDAGPKHHAARVALVDMLEGRKPPRAARAAFEAAADEAEIRVGSPKAWNNPIGKFLARTTGSPKAKVPRPKRR